MDWESAKAIAEIASSGLAALGGFWALWVYHGNSRRDRVRWADSLYKRFYERPELKAMRDVLDCSSGAPAVSQLVTEESSALTDYLNFFEFVAYLQSSKQLAKADVQALFGYYLDCLKRHPELVAYVEDESKGFEYLRKILSNA